MRTARRIIFIVAAVAFIAARSPKLGSKIEQGFRDAKPQKEIQQDILNSIDKYAMEPVKDSELEVINGKALSESTDTTGDIELYECKLVKVVDGDTIWVNDESGNPIKVRLIGIDTPESVHSDADKNTEWGTLASDHTKELLDGVDTVYLEYDEEKTDPYDRTLAYVWLSTDTEYVANMLNTQILYDGYAAPLFYEPNTKYKALFENLYFESVKNKNGLWGNDQFCEYASNTWLARD